MNFLGPVRCKATSTRSNPGEQCGNYCGPGMTVCRVHGGSAPQVRQAAKGRLQSLFPDAVEVFAKTLQNVSDCALCGNANYRDPLVLQAARLVIDWLNPDGVRDESLASHSEPLIEELTDEEFSIVDSIMRGARARLEAKEAQEAPGGSVPVTRVPPTPTVTEPAPQPEDVPEDVLIIEASHEET